MYAVIRSGGKQARVSPGDTLRLDLPNLPPQTAGSAAPHQPGDGGRAYLTEAEMKAEQRRNLLAVLTAANWRISGDGGAAELLGVKPSTLSDRMRAMGIRRPAKGAAGRK